MALTIIVIKVSVDEVQSDEWNITLNLTCEDGATEVINQDLTIPYRTGQDIETKVKTLQADMQAAIDEYNSEQ